MARLELALERARRQGEDYLFAVLFLDLDRFKVVNCQPGHMVGEPTIDRDFVNWNHCLQDTVACSGDEFTILLENIV